MYKTKEEVLNNYSEEENEIEIEEEQKFQGLQEDDDIDLLE